MDDKVYDGNTVATLSNLSLAGIVAGDRVSAATGSLGSSDTRQAGTGKAVSASGVQLTGDDAGNYAVDTAGIVGTGNISRRVLVASGARVDDKTCDGNTNASVSGLVLTGVVAGDQVMGDGGTGRFDSAATGNGKRVQVIALGLTGVDADNYTLAQASVDGTATIHPQVDATPAALVARRTRATRRPRPRHRPCPVRRAAQPHRRVRQRR